MNHVQFDKILKGILIFVQDEGNLYNISQHPFDTFVKIICHQQTYNSTGTVIHNKIKNICGIDFIDPFKFIENYALITPLTTELTDIRINIIYAVANSLSELHTAQNICDVIRNLPPAASIGKLTLENYKIDTGINTDYFPIDDTAVNSIIKQEFKMHVTEFVKYLELLEKLDLAQKNMFGVAFWYLQRYANTPDLLDVENTSNLSEF